jgi:hypothetical protein
MIKMEVKMTETGRNKTEKLVKRAHNGVKM